MNCMKIIKNFIVISKRGYIFLRKIQSPNGFIKEADWAISYIRPYQPPIVYLAMPS